MITHSETTLKISAALVKAQKNIGVAVKDTANPFFKSKYADLGSVMEACKDALNEQGIAVRQPLHSDANGYYVTTELRHESGEFFASTLKLLLSKQDMQQVGAAATYARRYGLQSMMFIPSEDDDGETAAGRGKPQEPPKQIGKPVIVKPAGTPPAPTPGIGIFCLKCDCELVLHESKVGYICPQAGPEGDGHQRVYLEDVERTRATQKRAQKVATWELDDISL